MSTRMLSNARERAAGSSVPHAVHKVLQSPSQPLDMKTRSFFEPRFSHDFSKVRIYAGTKAAESAKEINALAYTFRSNIVFRDGRPRLSTAHGRKLMAHELVHVIQQDSQPNDAMSLSSLSPTNATSPSEIEANFVADQILAGSSAVSIARQDRMSIQRQEDITPLATGKAGKAPSVPVCTEPDANVSAKNPLADISTFQSPGASGWWGAKFGCYRNSCSRRHRGWDLHAPVGTSIFAVTNGTMIPLNDPGGLGLFVKLRSNANSKLEYWYAHLSQRSKRGKYCAGDKIGETGASGNASADRPHLHFEIRLDGVSVDPGGYFSEPTMVIEETGSSATTIDKSVAPPCKPC